MDEALMQQNEVLIKQSEVLIALMARSVLGTKVICDVVTRGKKNPDAYVKAYNALDGTMNVTQVAKVAGVTPGTMTPILQGWEVQGIIYDAGKAGRPLYRRLLMLPENVQGRRSKIKEEANAE